MKVLDLFCGAGGAAMGLHRAWPNDEITGVDVVAQPRYPFRFVQADAMTYPLDGFDFIWASPPCQRYSRLSKLFPDRAASYEMLIERIRDRLHDTGTSYVMENVPGAPLIEPIRLCGTMFPGLRVYRHRLFESNRPLAAPDHPKHVEIVGTHRLATYNKTPGSMVTVAGHLFSVEAGSVAMGIDWMKRDELAEAIPPVYSEYVARQIR